MAAIKYRDPSTGKWIQINKSNEVHIGNDAPASRNAVIWVDTSDKSVKYRDSDTGVFVTVASGEAVDIDDTLTVPGAAADAAVVGEKISELSETINDSIDDLQKKIDDEDYVLTEVDIINIAQKAADMINDPIGGGLDVELTEEETAELESTISDLQNLKTSNTSVIAFLTDLHIGTGTPTKIKKAVYGYNRVADAVKTDLLLYGGDYMDNNPTTTKTQALTMYENLRSVLSLADDTCPAAVIKGNHDDNTMYTDYINGLVDKETFWKVLGNIDEDRTIRDAGNIEDCYGYYDIPNQKIRVFYVNTVDIPQKLYTALNKLNYRGQWDMGISVEQLQFIADHLKFDEAGWHVMVCSHHPLWEMTAAHGGAAILELLDKFNTTTSTGEISITAEDFEGTVSYDFSANVDCKMIACIHGHWHDDNVQIYNDSFFNISTRAVYGNPSHEGYISSSAYLVIDRNNEKLHLLYNGDGAENVFDYGNLTVGGDDDGGEPVYEQIDSPYTFGINNLDYSTGEPVYDAKMFWVVSEEICEFTKSALIDLSGYNCMYRPVWFDADGNYIGESGGWIDKAKPLEVAAGQTVRIFARNTDWSTWTEEKVATFTSAIKVYIEEGGEYHIINGDGSETEPDEPDIPDIPEHTHSYTSAVTKEAACTSDGVRTYTCSCGHSYTESIPATGHNYVDGACANCGAVDIGEIESPFEWQIGIINDTTGDVLSDAEVMRIATKVPVGFTKPATIDMSANGSDLYQVYWYDTEGNFIERGDSWISVSVPLVVPVDRSVGIKVRHNNYGLWNDSSVNTFAGKVRVYVESGGEPYYSKMLMSEIASPYTFGIANMNYDNGEPIGDPQETRIVSNEICGFTKTAKIDLSGYSCHYRIVLFDTDGNFVGFADSGWVEKSTMYEVPVGTCVRIFARKSSWGVWTATDVATFTEAVKITIEDGGEAYVVRAYEPPKDTVIEIGKPIENAVYGIGGSVSDGSFGIAVYGYPQRMVALSSNGENAFKDVNGICDRKIYPFAVPEGATKMTVTCPGYRCSIMSLNYENDAYTQVASTGWQELDEGTCSFTKAAITHVIVNFANSDWSNIPADTDTSGFSIQFD